MATWREFEAAAPEIAAPGRALIYQYGQPGGYLATVAPDGFPHIQPVRPAVEAGALRLRLRQPAAAYLRAHPRYAYHAEGPDDRDDEFYLAGHALSSGDGFELMIERALLATYRPRADGDTWPPKYDRWRDPTLQTMAAKAGPPAALPRGVSWEEFAAADSRMAEVARGQIRFVGIGLGFLATVRKDGAPRIHPFCPTFSGDRLYGLIVESPKEGDLRRNPRCAIHACLFPPSPNEVLLTCVAVHHHDPALAAQVRASGAADGMSSTNDEELFEFHIVGVDLIEHGEGGRRSSWRATAVEAR